MLKIYVVSLGVGAFDISVSFPFCWCEPQKQQYKIIQPHTHEITLYPLNTIILI